MTTEHDSDVIQQLDSGHVKTHAAGLKLLQQDNRLLN